MPFVPAPLSVMTAASACRLSEPMTVFDGRGGNENVSCLAVSQIIVVYNVEVTLAGYCHGIISADETPPASSSGWIVLRVTRVLVVTST
nr:hypothetical protein REQ54_04127 [Rhizobium sp. Q54]